MGPDLIHNVMLAHLSDDNQKFLCHMLNRFFVTMYVPPIWKHAIVIPIPKSGKPPSSPTSYRPISLTSCVSKVFEKIITVRLQWFLTKFNILPNTQSGFRKSRSTIDNLVYFDHVIKAGFSQGLNTYAVFLDINKAYDATSTQGLLFKLVKIGVNGFMLGWLENFLSLRSFHIRLGNVESDAHILRSDVPQGSVISPILFNIMVHDFPYMMAQHGQTLLFADDISFLVSSPTTNKAQQTLQQFLNSVSQWCSLWNFSISPDKCAIMVF